MVQNFLTAFIKHLNFKSFSTKAPVFFMMAFFSLQTYAVPTGSPAPVAASIPAKKIDQTKNKTKASRARIAIIVNKEVITYQDIEDRARLVVMTSGMENTPETLRTVEQQVKKSLIDEKIQLMAAKLQKVFVEESLKMKLKQLIIELKKTDDKINSSKEAMIAASENRDLNLRAYQNEIGEVADFIEAQIMEAFMMAQYQISLYERVELKAQLESLLNKTN